MEHSEQVRRPLKQIMINNFVGGIMWALGVFVGGTIVVAIIALIMSKVNLVPVVGAFVAAIIKYIQNNSHLLK